VTRSAPPPADGSHRRRVGGVPASRGVSVVEFVVASLLILIVLVGSSQAIVSSERALTSNRSRDVAATSAVNVLERAALLDCQMFADPSFGAGAASRCAASIFSDASLQVLASVAGGDQRFRLRAPAGCTTGSRGCVVFDATLSSSWRNFDLPAGSCAGSSPSGQPDVLDRRLRLTWTLAASTVSAEFVSAQAPPRSLVFVDPAARVVAVGASTGAPVMLTSSSGSTVRFAQACSGGPASGEAVFPFLPSAGVYTVRVLSSGAASPEAFQSQLSSTASVWSRAVDFRSVSCPSPGVLVVSQSGLVCRS